MERPSFYGRPSYVAAAVSVSVSDAALLRHSSVFCSTRSTAAAAAASEPSSNPTAAHKHNTTQPPPQHTKIVHL